MVTWQHAVQEYLDRESRTLAEATIKSYGVTLRQATQMLGPSKPIKTTTQTDLMDLLWYRDDSFMSRGLAPSVVNQRRDHLKTFMRWCQAMGYIRTDVTYKLRSLKVQKVERRRLDADLLLDALDATKNPRDRALIAVGTFTGCRVCEIKDFRLKDLDLSRWFISGKIPKTGKAYSARMCPELVTELTTWLDHYAKQMGFMNKEALVAHAKKKGLDWYVLPRLTRPILGGYKTIDTSSRTAVPDLPVENVYPMLRKVFAAIGIPEEDAKGEGFHTLRRSAARHMYEVACRTESSKDRAMRMVQLYLDHSTMAITEKYVGLSVEKASLNELLANQPLLGDAYENRYGGANTDNIVQFRKGEAS